MDVNFAARLFIVSKDLCGIFNFPPLDQSDWLRIVLCDNTVGKDK